MSEMSSGVNMDRLLKRIQLYVRGNSIKGSTYRRLLASLPGAVGQDAELRARLGAMGIAIVDENPPAAAGASRVLPPRDGGLGTAEPDRLLALRAAQQVLEQDRSHPRPFNRILTAEAERGLALLLREGAPAEETMPSGYRRSLDDGSEAAQAFDALVVHNLRLVWSIAARFCGQGLDMEDLSQAGMFGLIRAVEMFDATHGTKFSTYATNWIHQSITRELANTSRTVRLPVHVVEQVKRVTATRARLFDHGLDASVESISGACDIEAEKVRWLLDLSRRTVSLDLILGDGDASLGDLVADASLPGPESQLVAAESKRAVREALAALTWKEADVIAMRFGLEDGEPKTLEEIGQVFGVTRERIRQIEAKALEKLRSPMVARQLRWVVPVLAAAS